MVNTLSRNINDTILKVEKYDKVALNSIMRRQYYVLQDLFMLHDKYPNIIDSDLVGSLDSLFRVMCDMTDSITHTR